MALDEERRPTEGGGGEAAPKFEKATPKIERGMGPSEVDEATLDAELRNAFRQSQVEGRADSDDEPEADEPAPKPKAKAPPKSEEVASERERGPDGKFKAKDGDQEEKDNKDKDLKGKNQEPIKKKSEAAESEEDDSADEKASKVAKVAPKSAESSDEDDSDESDAPESWRGKSVWKGMSREARQHAAARETEHTETTKKLGAYSEIGKVINAHAHTFQRHNAPFAQGVQMMLRVQDALDTNPKDAIAKIAQTYGIDLAREFGGQQRDDDAGREIDEAFDSPATAELRRELAELKQWRQEREHREQQAAQLYQQRQQQDNLGLVNRIADDKANYPHFAELQADIFTRIRELQVSHPQLQGEALLKRAYDDCCKTNDKVREKIEAAKRAAKDAEARKAEADKKARDSDHLNVSDESHEVDGDDDEDAVLRKAFRRSNRNRDRRAA